ncbi:MAG: thioredoxin family protein [Campylobacterota bacterium]|nr:thioredoxin family protein [Campylobacterota bacterium]
MAIIEVDEIDFKETLDEAFSNGQIVVLKFSATFCDACMAQEFELEEIDEKYDNITILEIDCGESEQLADLYGIVQVPTMIIYKDENTTLWNKEGVILAADIENIIGL